MKPRAGQISVNTSGLLVVTHTNVQSALADLDAAIGKPVFRSSGNAGLTGATAATRYVGGTASGAPTSGTFAVGDFVIDQTGKIWVCTTAGTPGTWSQVGGGGGSVPSVQTYTPVWTGNSSNPSLGNGTIWGRYWQTADKAYTVSIGLKMGSTTTYGSGPWEFSLPSLTVADLFGGGLPTLVGAAFCEDSSASAYYDLTAWVFAHTHSLFPDKILLGRGAGAGGDPLVTSSLPFVWASGDLLYLTADIITT